MRGRRTWLVSVWTERRESDPLKDGNFLGWALGENFCEVFHTKRPGRAIALAIVASGFTGRVHATVERVRVKSGRQEIRRMQGCWGTRRERQARPYTCAARRARAILEGPR